ncbi:tetratricopeptide repeat protein [Candidatus Omnitrophota bacterium]
MKITARTHILFIVLIIVIVFSGSLKNDFVWDDKYLIIDNPHIKSLDYLHEIFTTQLYEGSQVHSNFYRPLQLLSFALDYSVWGLNPFGYHLTNLFLHIFNSALVYLILIAISSSAGLAMLSATFFAISPAISGIVYYISARSDLLMALFVFSSLLFFIKYIKCKNAVWYIFSLVSFALALLCKEMSIILLALLALQLFRSEKRARQRLTMLLPYIVILIFYIALRFSILNFARGANPLIDFNYPATIPLWRRVLTDFKVIPKYIGLLLFPYGLHMDSFVEPAKSLFQVDVLFFMALFIFLVLIIKKASRLSDLVIFGALWFLLTLLPVLNIYPISVFFGEGWLYMPCVGFFIVLSVICQKAVRPKAGRTLSNILIVIFFVYYALLNINYGRVWKDSISLFHNVLKYETESPFIYLTYNNLAMAYYDKGEYNKSIEYCKKSISLSPDYQDAYNNLGVTYMTIQKPVKAIAHFKKAISLKKDYVFAYRNLAHVYSYIGLTDSAIRFSNMAIELDRYSYKSYCNLGYIFLDKGDLGKAIESFKKAEEMEMRAWEPHYALGSLYIKKNKLKEAIDEYEEALSLGLRDYVFYNELAILYIKNDDLGNAERLFRKSLALNSNQAGPHNNLGNLYSLIGRFDLAIKEYERALAINPDNSAIVDNIKKTRFEWNGAHGMSAVK